MGDVLAVRQEYRLREWAMVVEECRLSGLSNRAYCRERGISEKTYYYWLRRLRQAAITAAGEPTQNKLVEVSLREDAEKSGGLSLSFKGAELTVTDETSEAALRTVLRVLREI